MSRTLFGNILRAEILVVVSIPADMLWCLWFQSWGIHRTVITVSIWIGWRISRKQSIEQTVSPFE